MGRNENKDNGMNFNLKEMYSYLLSHTFPGLLFLVEILIFLHFTICPNIFSKLMGMVEHGSGILIIGGYAFSTLLGTMLDGVQHFIFDFFVDMEGCCKNYNETLKKNEKDANAKYLALNNEDSRIKAYEHFIDDDLWYPYEAYSNIIVAMVFGLILLVMGSLFGFWVGFGIIFFIILGALCFEAQYTYQLCEGESKEFFKNKDQNV